MNYMICEMYHSYQFLNRKHIIFPFILQLNMCVTSVVNITGPNRGCWTIWRESMGHQISPAPSAKKNLYPALCSGPTSLTIQRYYSRKTIFYSTIYPKDKIPCRSLNKYRSLKWKCINKTEKFGKYLLTNLVKQL